MRTIKFRAWNKEQNIMVQVRTLFFNGDGSIKAITLWTEDLDGCIYVPKLKNVILMQYTGLLDKNGKEIYEGDILKVFTVVGFDEEAYENIEGYKNYEVCWDSNRACFMLGDNETDFAEEDDFEVIGNIYENPELLN